MRHITYADRPVLVGDDAADTLLEFAGLIAARQDAETVTLRAITPEGVTVDASYLLTPSTELLIESSLSDLEPPDNDAVVEEMKNRIADMTRPVEPTADDGWHTDCNDFDELA